MQCLHCDNEAAAKGLCSMHYVRARKGQDLTAPKMRIRGRICFCGKPAIENGMCAAHKSHYKREEAAKALLSLHGDGCHDCKVTYPFRVYDFHHLNPKTKSFGISEGIVGKSLEAVLEESKKCVMLCANCHRLRHLKENDYYVFCEST